MMSCLQSRKNKNKINGWLKFFHEQPGFRCESKIPITSCISCIKIYYFISMTNSVCRCMYCMYSFPLPNGQFRFFFNLNVIKTRQLKKFRLELQYLLLNLTLKTVGYRALVWYLYTEPMFLKSLKKRKRNRNSPLNGNSKTIYSIYLVFRFHTAFNIQILMLRVIIAKKVCSRIVWKLNLWRKTCETENHCNEIEGERKKVCIAWKNLPIINKMKC